MSSLHAGTSARRGAMVGRSYTFPSSTGDGHGVTRQMTLWAERQVEGTGRALSS